MINVQKNNAISIVKGDTGIINLKINRAFVSGDTVYFTVKKNIADTTSLISKTITPAAGSSEVNIQLSKIDTAITPEIYFYDIQINFADGIVDTVVGPVLFEVIGGVTDV